MRKWLLPRRRCRRQLLPRTLLTLPAPMLLRLSIRCLRRQWPARTATPATTWLWCILGVSEANRDSARISARGCCA